MDEALAAIQANATTTLDLGYNRVGPDGARALADALKENTTLTTLGLSRNGIGDDGAQALLAAITDLLDVDLNVTCAGNQTLETLDLDDNDVTDDVYKRIQEHLAFRAIQRRARYIKPARPRPEEFEALQHIRRVHPRLMQMLLGR